MPPAMPPPPPRLLAALTLSLALLLAPCARGAAQPPLDQLCLASPTPSPSPTPAFVVPSPSPTSSPSPAPVVNPILRPIDAAPAVVVESRLHASLPPIDGAPAKIVGIVHFHDSLFVTTSVSGGGVVFRVFNNGKAFLWFNASDAMLRDARRCLDIAQPIHGGLRGLAFHPSFHTNGRFYVTAMETRLPPAAPAREYLSSTNFASRADSVLLEFRADRKTLVPVRGSYRVVFRVAMPVYDHPIKQIVFHGRYLYIGHGDGSIQSATVGGGQQPGDALGKVLRIDPLERDGRPYTVPNDNPYIGRPGFLPELYAIGFRNPHNLCFSRRPGNPLFVVDVGRDNVEEINIVTAGGDYGWPEREGPFTHLDRGGVGTGVTWLPRDDARYNYTYPAVAVGHEARAGRMLVGQALAASCPIENGSPLDGYILHGLFGPGEMFVSRVQHMLWANTRGDPGTLSRAGVLRPTLTFDHDSDPATPSISVRSFLDIVKMTGGGGGNRVDVRFGRGKRGEIFWSSKSNGKIYVVASSIA